MVVNLTKQGIKMNYFIITGYFITAEQYFNKNRKAYEEMKVFLSAFVCSARSSAREETVSHLINDKTTSGRQ